MNDPIILLDAVSRFYTTGDVEVRALDGVSMAIEGGEFVAVMGPSGSGKSTLMNILGCLDRPTGGRYVLAGREVSHLRKTELADVRSRTLGFVFQNFNLLPRTSALENVELPLLYQGTGARERRARATEALGRVGLGSRAGHHPNQLSGGQQQRVAIARALVTRPRVILADEPTGNLDSRTSLEVMALFQELGGQGITILVVTHESEVSEFASRVIVVKDGHIRSDERRTPKVVNLAAAAGGTGAGE
jgi:putative ABC transport system ATP-binding protein